MESRLSPHRHPHPKVSEQEELHYKQSQGTILGTQLSLTILALVFIFIHLHTSFTNAYRPPAANDYFILLAIVLAFTHLILTLASIEANVGFLLQVAFFKTIIDAVIVCAAQLSVLLLLLRLSPSRRYRWFILGMVVYCICSCIAWICYPIVGCSTLWSAWKNSEAVACNNLIEPVLPRAIICSLAYIGIVLVSFPTVRRYQLSKKEKFIVACVMLAGLIPCTFLMIRLALLIVHFDADPIWWTIFSDNLSVAEYCSAIIIASLIHIEPIHYRRPTAVNSFRKEQKESAVVITRSPLAERGVHMRQTTGVEHV